MLTLVAGPADDVVIFADVKAALAIIGDADDDLLRRLIDGVVAQFDGPYGSLGRCLSDQTWRLDLPAFPVGNIRLPMPPIRAVSGISYRHADGSEVALDVSEFSVSGLGSHDGCFIGPKTRWPSTHSASVEFVAGFGTAVPDDIQHAIIAAVGSAYAWRESQVVATGRLQENPEIVAVIDRWRVRGFGG